MNRRNGVLPLTPIGRFMIEWGARARLHCTHAIGIIMFVNPIAYGYRASVLADLDNNQYLETIYREGSPGRESIDQNNFLLKSTYFWHSPYLISKLSSRVNVEFQTRAPMTTNLIGSVRTTATVHSSDPSPSAGSGVGVAGGGQCDRIGGGGACARTTQLVGGNGSAAPLLMNTTTAGASNSGVGGQQQQFRPTFTDVLDFTVNPYGNGVNNPSLNSVNVSQYNHLKQRLERMEALVPNRDPVVDTRIEEGELRNLLASFDQEPVVSQFKRDWINVLYTRYPNVMETLNVYPSPSSSEA